MNYKPFEAGFYVMSIITWVTGLMLAFYISDLKDGIANGTQWAERNSQGEVIWVKLKK